MTTTRTVLRGDLVAAARELRPLLRENAAAGEAAGWLTEPVVEALHDVGLPGMWVPVPLGGAELDPCPHWRSSRPSRRPIRPPRGS